MPKLDIQGKAMMWLMKSYTSPLVEKLKLRKPLEKMTYNSVKRGFKFAEKISSPKKNKKGSEVKKPKLVFDLSPTDEQRMICDEVQRFAETVMRPAAYQADKENKLPENLFEASQALGLSYLAAPESLGGASTAIEPMTSVLITEKLAWGDMSLAYALTAPLCFANVIRRWGTAEQQEKFLTLFIEETPPKAVVALQEASLSFDPWKLKTQAKKNGRGFVLNGEKILLPLSANKNKNKEAENNKDTKYYCVVAQYKNKPQLFIVDANSQGVSFEEQSAMGLKAAETGKLILKNVQVDKDALVGDGKSFDYQKFLDLGRLHVSALALGCCQAVLDYVIPYVNEREAFGEPISHRQGVAFMVADMALEIEGMRLLLWRATSRAQAGLDFHQATSLAHALCCEKAMQIGTQGVQLLGGHGFTKEHPVELWYRDLRAIAILSGGHA